MAEPFLSEIRMMAFSFAPRGWAFANGQLLPINQNQALFSLLGTNYGGDGRVNFGLPNLQGRVPMHMGSNAGNSHVLGERGGESAHTLSIGEIPGHAHTLQATSVAATVATPTGNLLAASAATDPIYNGAANLVALGPSSVAVAGGSQPHLNMQPYLVLNFCIALQGIFPAS